MKQKKKEKARGRPALICFLIIAGCLKQNFEHGKLSQLIELYY